MSKIKKTLSTLVCVPIMAGMIALGCSPERLDGTNNPEKKPKIEYPGMPSYNTNDEFPFGVISYIREAVFKKTPSAKKGLTPEIPLDGELVSLKTFYEYGVPKNAEKDKDGFYPTECTGIIQVKELRYLKSKDMSTTPMFTKEGNITLIDYDDKLDKKIDVRLITRERYDQSKLCVVKTQELDIGADGTIEERLVTSSYEEYTFEKALE